VTRVCYACLDAFFTKCEVCGEYWDDSYVEFFVLKDGRMICEHCREDFDDEEIDFES
jgi:formylmethanofuran dehydrogenase subunit E